MSRVIVSPLEPTALRLRSAAASTSDPVRAAWLRFGVAIVFQVNEPDEIRDLVDAARDVDA